MEKVVFLLMISFSSSVYASEPVKNLNRGVMRERLLDQQQKSLEFWKNDTSPNFSKPRIPFKKDSYIGCQIDLDTKTLICPEEKSKF